ncbi:3-deoxy-manno-octulosonate cytidylyltransferase [bacterium BMS3Abin07]|nr:3-deoxy-manno-octulosonate cytidylyltransferase [bacterium BMS3Abin07]GBE31362.1 3-deoxy-manno-octulosonate cytidylyltransferase [bacterium BMS3Bbin05]HDO22359.1 3-deoxy-manno-octulosonate cytidylyltransferase [Nitrospirota bacterium]HDZ88415.1 3-deoxy-manno-octulosonate cytidylyltransferase [Nitrospirota bacterium]
MRSIAIIPARYGSSRFPGKPLALLNDKPLIQHVCENAMTAARLDRVMVATDDEKIRRAVESFGVEAVITSSDLPSGTDRIAGVANKLDYDIIVNIQGDEPLINGKMIDDVIKIHEDNLAEIGTLMKKINKMEEIFDPNIVKVVVDNNGFALYFSRAPIPFYRDEFQGLKVAGCGLQVQKSVTNNPDSIPGIINVYKHIGIYSYRKDVLLRLTGLPQSRLEKAEKLEQLRALENGVRIRVMETEYETIGVDTPEDLGKVGKWLSTYS